MQKLVPYLMFDGHCEEAMNFYRSILGGEFGYLGRFGDMPVGAAEEAKNLIMHVDLNFFGSVLYASDRMPQNNEPCEPGGNNVFLSLNFEDADHMDRCFRALAEGGRVTQPLQDMFWGDRFGKLTDKYGFNWMFVCPLKKE